MSDRSGNTPIEVLGGISAEHFLKAFWQKKPLLVRQAFPDFECPVSPEELAGLALEEDVESRIILEKGKNSHWELQTGPFDPKTFASLPPTHWTLLIQQLDAWVEEINTLKQNFNFIPNWRIDDIMASYAPFGGSVGPHYDQYDVFLIQALGHRHWQLGQMCTDESPRLPDTALNILSEFDTQDEWNLAPGDMLYLPPGLAHHGVAQDDCITLSVGFRAPTQRQLVNSFVDYLNASEFKDIFYQDPDLKPSERPAEVSDAVLTKVHALMLSALSDNESFERWFCEFSSEAKNSGSLGEADTDFSSSDLLELINNDTQIYQNEGSRFVYTQREEQLIWGIDGESYVLPATDIEAVRYISENTFINTSKLMINDEKSETFKVMIELFRQGSLYC